MDLLPPNGHAVQLRPTALTASAEAQAPGGRMLSRTDWAERSGGSCRLLVGQQPYEAELSLSAKLAGVAPRTCLDEAARRAIRNPGIVTLSRDLN